MTAGIGYDTITLDDTLSVSATPANPFVINMLSLDPTNAPGLASFDSSQNYSWTLLTAPHGISSLDLSAISLNLGGFQNNLDGGSLSVSTSGDQLLLNFATAVPTPPPPIPAPEPTSAALVLSGLTLLGKRCARRRA